MCASVQTIRLTTSSIAPCSAFTSNYANIRALTPKPRGCCASIECPSTSGSNAPGCGCRTTRCSEALSKRMEKVSAEPRCVVLTLEPWGIYSLGRAFLASPETHLNLVLLTTAGRGAGPSHLFQS